MPTTPCALYTKHAHLLHLKCAETEDEGLERKLATHGLAASGASGRRLSSMNLTPAALQVVVFVATKISLGETRLWRSLCLC
jgi:hypothetical protein